MADSIAVNVEKTFNFVIFVEKYVGDTVFNGNEKERNTRNSPPITEMCSDFHFEFDNEHKYFSA